MGVLFAWPGTGQAQAPRFEAGLQALGVLADRSYAGGGPWLAWRPGANTRVGMLGTVGGQGGSTAGRLELVGHFMLDPDRLTGVGLYGLAGVAWSIAERSSGFLMAGVGAESSPGGSGGWVLEFGVGGGWRLSAGYRRRFGARRHAR
jgi:hypothetical protein